MQPLQPFSFLHVHTTHSRLTTRPPLHTLTPRTAYEQPKQLTPHNTCPLHGTILKSHGPPCDHTTTLSDALTTHSCSHILPGNGNHLVQTLLTAKPLCTLLPEPTYGTINQFSCSESNKSANIRDTHFLNLLVLPTIHVNIIISTNSNQLTYK